MISYRDQMLYDLSLDVVQSELVVSGLFGKCLTGPWMTCLYRKAGLSKLGSCGSLSYMVSKLRESIDCPRLLWNKNFCCFDIHLHLFIIFRAVEGCVWVVVQFFTS